MADRHVISRNEQPARDRIRDFVLTTLLAGEDPINLTDTTPLVSSGIIDSVTSLKVGRFLEQTFAVVLAPEEVADPDNLESIVAIERLVRSKQSGRERPGAKGDAR